MNTKGSAIGLFFCFFTLFILGDCSPCNRSLLEGDTLRFKLTDKSLDEEDRFAIKQNNVILVQKKHKKQTGPGTVNIDSLEFQNVKLTNAGKYDVEVHNKAGIGIKSYSETVCVYAKVPKPILNMTECQKEKANFSCIVSSKDLTYSWQKNGKDFKHDKVNLENVEANKSKYTCTVHNPVHKSTSDPVEATCYTSPTLFGFDFWIMVSILAGGGGLVLLLTIVLVTVACRSCKRKEKQLRDEEEFRLNYLNTTPSNGQKSKTTARGQPAPPEPYDNVSAHDVPYENESKPKKQHRARPPPPPEEDEEEPPPPLPQPRKVKKHEA